MSIEKLEHYNVDERSHIAILQATEQEFEEPYVVFLYDTKCLLDSGWRTFGTLEAAKEWAAEVLTGCRV